MVLWDGMDSWDLPSESVPVGDAPKLSILSHGTTGWDVQLGFTKRGWYNSGMFLNHPSCPVVQRDGMDSWDLPSEGPW